MSIRCKVLLCLAALFLLGAATGSVVTLRLCPERAAARPNAEARWMALTLADYQKRLGLSDKQVEELRPVFKRTGLKMETLRGHTVERLHELLAELDGQVTADLTPEQRAKMADLQGRRRARSD